MVTRHRVFVPQALGADQFLRVTWHEDDRIVVFSHWEGDTCIAATPVRIADVPELAELLADAVGVCPAGSSDSRGRWAGVDREAVSVVFPIADSA